MRNRIIALATAAALSVTCLVGCKSSASYTQVLGDAKVEVKELDGTTEGEFDLPYSDIRMEVEMESGTVDIEVIDVDILDDDTVIEWETICESKGATTGDGAIFTDDNGQIRVRVTSSDGATGTISFSAA